MTFLSTQLGARIGRWLAAAVVLGATGCSAVAADTSCTLVGCETRATLSTSLAVPRPNADLLAITACRNSVCGTTTIQLETGGVQTVTPPATGPRVDLRLGPTAGAPGGEGGASIIVLGDNAEVKDGDVYRITVEDRTGGGTLLDVTTSPARYVTVQPNGARCDREYHCLQSTLTPR